MLSGSLFLRFESRSLHPLESTVAALWLICSEPVSSGGSSPRVRREMIPLLSTTTASPGSRELQAVLQRLETVQLTCSSGVKSNKRHREAQSVRCVSVIHRDIPTLLKARYSRSCAQVERSLQQTGSAAGFSDRQSQRGGDTAPVQRIRRKTMLIPQSHCSHRPVQRF